MESKYSNEIMRSIEFQEFYCDVNEHYSTEIFEDILDFMYHYCPNWYENIEEYSSELLSHHINLYHESYFNPEIARRDLLYSLYIDLVETYKQMLISNKYYLAEEKIRQMEDEPWVKEDR